MYEHCNQTLNLVEFKNNILTRDAKVFYLQDKDWKELRNLFTEHVNFMLQEKVAIFQISNYDGKYASYAIISVSDDCDEIIINYGGKTYEKNDAQIYFLRKGGGTSCYLEI